ncbi:hypothetical protein BH20BAC1_BH20BAC1_18730 [soil metagenome]
MEIQNHLLGEIHQELQIEPVSVGTRFVHYLIDLIIFNIFYYALTIFLITGEMATSYIMIMVLNLVTYLGYYTIMEGATGGKTVGKMATGSRTVREDGQPFTFNDAFMRSLCRCVPFEPFSAFGGHPWHDRWTHTRVVTEKK